MSETDWQVAWGVFIIAVYVAATYALRRKQGKVLADDSDSERNPARLECQECGTQYVREGDRILIFKDHIAFTPINGFCNFSCGAAAGGRGPY